MYTCPLQELVTELHMQSIFTDVGKLSLQDPSHSAVIPSSVGQTGSPSTSTSWLSQSGEAHYALASPAGGIMVVTLPPHDTQGKEVSYVFKCVLKLHSHAHMYTETVPGHCFNPAVHPSCL